MKHTAIKMIQMDQAPRMMMELRSFLVWSSTPEFVLPPCIKGVVIGLGGEVLQGDLLVECCTILVGEDT
jgi:hypothetical protein